MKEPVSCVSPALVICQPDLALLGLYTELRYLPSSSRGILSVCTSVQIYPFYKDTAQTALNCNLNGVIQFDYLRDPISK